MEKPVIQRYQIPLKKPLFLKGCALTHREGLLLQLWDEFDNMGLGEISPLPNFSQESLESVLEAPHNREMASVDCGWFLAEASLAAQKQGISLPNYLHQLGKFETALPAEVCLNGLIDAQEKTAFVKEVERVLAEGFRSVKIKVGRTTVAQDIERLHWLKELTGTTLSVRLDANQAWRLEEALNFARGVSQFSNIEYIEEPCANLSDTQSFAQQSQFPVALDESLSQYKPQDILSFAPFASAFILKPMLLKGFWKYFKQLRKSNQKVIISSSFESGIGMQLLIALAAISGEVAGLDTYAWLSQDVLTSPIEIRNGKISLEQVYASPLHWRLS